VAVVLGLLQFSRQRFFLQFDARGQLRIGDAVMGRGARRGTAQSHVLGRTPWYAVVAAPLMLTGTQSLVPALPAMQEALSLTSAQIGLFMGAYFLPSIIFAVPAGMLADRYGRRAVFTGGLVVFGLCGLVMTLWHDSFTFLLVSRSVQGMGFAAVLPLTMTLISDSRVGGNQVKGQSHRSVAMKVGETLGPAAGGALVLVTWFAPIALQVLALPLAAVAWRHVPTGRTMGGSVSRSMGVLLAEFKHIRFLFLQSVGFFRFFFKFGFLTFMPLLAIEAGLLSIFETGIVLTVSAASALVVAAVMARTSLKYTPSVMLGASLVIVGLSLIAIGASESAWMLIAGSIAFGMADSASSIIYSAIITQAVNDDMRATFVAANGAIRNLGKFMAPIGLGLVLLVWAMSITFVLLGAAAIVVGLSTRSLREFDNFHHGRGS
jgi:MFS family permease|tara:strand:- start:4894 stop:6195 length:1302 start_codon:yes stop_codon:yes gene_type:complete